MSAALEKRPFAIQKPESPENNVFADGVAGEAKAPPTAVNYSVAELEAIAKAAASAMHAVDGLNHAMKRTGAMHVPWGLLAAAFAAGGLLTFVLFYAGMSR